MVWPGRTEKSTSLPWRSLLFPCEAGARRQVELYESLFLTALSGNRNKATPGSAKKMSLREKPKIEQNFHNSEVCRILKYILKFERNFERFL